MPKDSKLVVSGGFAVTVITLMTALITSASRARVRQTGPAAADPDLDRVADLLAVAVKTQWEQAAGERGLAEAPIPVTWGRPSLPLAGPVAAAARSRQFASLPGLTPVGEEQLAEGRITDVHAVYGGLRSGRLVIAGPPGSGKSGAAVLLVLEALEHRDQAAAENRPKIPVPVLFTARDWNPRRQLVKEWLTRRLRETYPLFAGRTGAKDAARLIDAGKISVILDGLDEIAEELRPIALQALSQQASFRVVVLSRTAEMASAASQCGVLQGAAAIEIRAVNSSTAADYLQRVQLDPPPDGWRDLIDRLRANPGSPLASALNSPLTLTLIRDTYLSGDDARELLDYCDATQQRGSDTQVTEEITDHLLDRILPSAYAHRPGHPSPRYDLQTARNALAKIAAHMNQESTRDLQWWHIPEWIPPAQRLVVGLGIGLMIGLAFGLAFGLEIGLVVGLEVGLVIGLEAYSSKGPPRRRGTLQWRLIFKRSNLGVGLGYGLVAGLLTGTAAAFR